MAVCMKSARAPPKAEMKEDSNPVILGWQPERRAMMGTIGGMFTVKVLTGGNKSLRSFQPNSASSFASWEKILGTDTFLDSIIPAK